MKKNVWRRALGACLCGVMLLSALPASTAVAEKITFDHTPIKVACVGTSITQGTDGHSYPAYLQMMLGDDYEVRNFGYPGAAGTKGTDFSYMETKYNGRNLFEDSLAYQGDIVIIDMGGNDAQPGIAGLGKFQESYEELVSAYQKQGNDPLILLAVGGRFLKSPTQWGHTNELMNNTIKPAQLAVAEKLDVAVADWGAALAGHDEYFSGDGVHYKGPGYKAMAQLFYDELKKLAELPESQMGSGLFAPPERSIAMSEYDGYNCLTWDGKTGGFSYTSGMLAMAFGLDNGTVVKNMTVYLSYYWNADNGGNDWWHFNTTDKDGLSAPGIANGNPHDNGFGLLSQYGMSMGRWDILTVSRDDQLLGGNGPDWMVNMGDFNAAHDLYVRGYEIVLTLQDGTVKKLTWGTVRGRRGADDGVTLKVACVGMSTTAGKCVAEDKGTSYPAFLQEMLGGVAEVKNYGYPGTCVSKGTQLSYIGSSYYTQSLAYKADVVIIDMGGNDSQAPLWNRGTFQKDYKELVEAYQNQGNDPLILLSVGGHCIESTEYVSTWGVPGKDTIGKWGTDDDTMKDKIQPAQEAVAAELGLMSANLRVLLTSDPDAYICKEDGVHYTDVGYKAMAQMYYDALMPHLELPADRAALREALADEVTMLEGFSAESVQAYRAALAKAQQVMNDKDATAEEIESAAAALVAAKAGLTVAVRMGDVDADGEVTSTDARLVLQRAAGKIEEEALDISEAADVDGDGNITSTDARLILQYAAGKIEDFPKS